MSCGLQSVDRTYMNLISFVPQRASTVSVCNPKDPKVVVNNASGDSAKSFYESLINECTSTGINKTSTGAKNDKHKKKKKNHADKPKQSNLTTCSESLDPSKQQREIHKLFRAAEKGDCEEVSRLVQSGFGIDTSDRYGWTPLMCAAYAGHLECVSLCLTLGADRSLRNHSNQTAEDLANFAGHSEVTEAISAFENFTQNVDEQQAQSETCLEPVWCDKCGVSVSDARSHFTSTVHLLNSGQKRAAPAYLIPHTNRGFQVCVRSKRNIFVKHNLCVSVFFVFY